MHPPQIRRIATLLAKDLDLSTQVVVSTHSDELVKGLLDAGPDRVRVIRLRRTTVPKTEDHRSHEINRVAVLDQSEIAELWKDPLLRTSDVLSAVFHDVAIIVEGEVDARFYGAMIDAMLDENRKNQEVSKAPWRVPDLRLYYGVGKGSIAKLVRQLRAVQVPVLAVSDIDLLENQGELASSLAAFGVKFIDAKSDWQLLNQTMRLERPVNSVAHIEALVAKIMSSVSDKTGSLLPKDRNEIIAAVKDSGSWTGLRKQGEAWFVNEMAVADSVRHAKLRDAELAFQRLIARARTAGLHILSTGAVEKLFSPGWKQGCLVGECSSAAARHRSRISGCS